MCHGHDQRLHVFCHKHRVSSNEAQLRNDNRRQDSVAHRWTVQNASHIAKADVQLLVRLHEQQERIERDTGDEAHDNHGKQQTTVEERLSEKQDTRSHKRLEQHQHGVQDRGLALVLVAPMASKRRDVAMHMPPTKKRRALCGACFFIFFFLRFIDLKVVELFSSEMAVEHKKFDKALERSWRRLALLRGLCHDIRASESAWLLENIRINHRVEVASSWQMHALGPPSARAVLVCPAIQILSDGTARHMVWCLVLVLVHAYAARCDRKGRSTRLHIVRMSTVVRGRVVWLD